MDQVQAYSTQFSKQEIYTSRQYAIIKSLLDSNNFSYHLIESRTKSVDSFRDKLDRKGIQYKNPLIDITDLTGIRIIFYYEDLVGKLVRLLKKAFQIDEAKSSYKLFPVRKADQFGYFSPHLIVQPLMDEDIYKEINLPNYQFEIQIRTVLQHAWSSISHQLQYKSQNEIPNELQRQLFRLAGLFELVDEEFMSIRDKHSSLYKKVSLIEDIENAAIAINLLSLEKYIESSELVTELFDLAIGIGFKDIKYHGSISQNESLSHLVSICEILDISTISDLHAFISDSNIDFEKYFRNLYSANYYIGAREWYISEPFLIILILLREVKGDLNNFEVSSRLDFVPFITPIIIRALEE